METKHRSSHAPTDPVLRRQAPVIRRRLLHWYDVHQRPLPWRKTRNPYRIWVSEIMLQQTRVQAVIPYYEKFLRRFPSVQAVASADEEELLAHWSGLGHYSRARNLQKAAQVIVKQHQGRFPRDAAEALALPGIGTYTAAAVLSIAYRVPLPVVDGNVARVLSRLFALSADIRSNSGKQSLLQIAGLLLARRRAGEFNQALMELGATICLPRNPKCDLCPLRKNCVAHARNETANFPITLHKTKPAARRFKAALILDDGKCLLIRRPAAAQWMQGFWELPMQEETVQADSRKGRLEADTDPLSEDGIQMDELLGNVQHTITTNQLSVAVYRATLQRPANPPLERWVPVRRIHLLPVTTITRKALRWAQTEADS